MFELFKKLTGNSEAEGTARVFLSYLVGFNRRQLKHCRALLYVVSATVSVNAVAQSLAGSQWRFNGVAVMTHESR